MTSTYATYSLDNNFNQEEQDRGMLTFNQTNIDELSKASEQYEDDKNQEYHEKYGIVEDDNIKEDNQYVKEEHYIIDSGKNIINYDLEDNASVKIQSKSNSNIFTYNNILNAANRTANFIDNYNRLPSVVVIDNKNVNMNDLLYLLCKTTNSTDSVTVKNYSHVESTSGTNQPEYKLYKNDYIQLANEIIKCYELNNRNPKNCIYNDITMNFDDTVYFYARVIAFKYNNQHQANYVTIKPLYNNDYSTDVDALITTTTTPFTINTTVKSIGNNQYNLTLTPSQACTIYYTRNGTTPTNKDKIYSKTLTINNNTWIQYYGIKSNGQKTPILSFGIYRPSTPYITNKPQLESNGYENKITIAVSQNSKIYYTINGTKPTQKSTLYTQDLYIHNNTLLQYISVTDKNKISPVYYYKLNNPQPYTTILNQSDVRDNHQNITIIANKPGKIYYSRNGTTPQKDKVYTSTTKMDLNIKTVLKTIIVDQKNTQSTINTYKPPKIITPPTTIIKAITALNNNNQKIQFITNKANTTIYYTIDGSDPKNSNTTKNITANTQITIHKTTHLKYYTKDNQEQYTSNIILYRTPQNNIERPTLTIFNTSNIWNNGQQKIMIQSNQPSIIYYDTIFTNKNATTNTKYTKEIIINNKDKINIHTKYDNINSKIIQYNPLNKTKTLMNYSYIIPLEYEEMNITIKNKIVKLNKQTFTALNNKIYLYIYRTNTLVLTNNINIIEPHIKIYKTGNTINIQQYDYIIGNTNQLSFSYKFEDANTLSVNKIINANKEELIKIRYKKQKTDLDTTNISQGYYDITYKVINIETLFTSNFNNRISHTVQVGTMLKTENIQTIILTNEIINKNVISNWLNRQYSTNELKKGYGTFLTGLTLAFYSDQLRNYYANKLNITWNRLNELQFIVNENQFDIITIDIRCSFYKITSSKTYEDTLTFNFINGLLLSYLEFSSLKTSNLSANSPIHLLYEDCLNNGNFTFELDTENNEITIYNLNNNVYNIIVDLNTGYVSTILNFTTLKDTTIRYTSDNKIQSNLNLIFNDLFNITGGGGQGIWMNNNNDFLNNSQTLKSSLNTLFNLTQSDIGQEVIHEVMDLGGQTLITSGLMIAATGGGAPVGAVMVVAGIILCFGSTGGTVTDIFNAYYWADALPSIATAVIPGFIEVKGVLKTLKYANILSKTAEGKKFIVTVTATTNIDTADYEINDSIRDNCISNKIKDWLKGMGVPGDNRVKI